ncbi:hypothetical protein KM043_000047, partial [Ampulex compressa]
PSARRGDQRGKRLAVASIVILFVAPGSRPKIDEAGASSEGDPIGSRVQVSSDEARRWTSDSAGGGRGVVPWVEQLGYDATGTGASRRRGKDEDRAKRAVRGRTVARDWTGTELTESSDARCAGAGRWRRSQT